MSQVREENYKGHELFAIYPDGELEPKVRPIVSFGARKARAILAHVDELRAWVKKQPESGDGGQA